MKEWIKKDKAFRVPGFLCKRIAEKEGCSLEEAKAILDQTVAEDRSLRYIKVYGGKDKIGREKFHKLPSPPKKWRIAYHPYLEPGAVYTGAKRGRPRDWQRDYARRRKHP